MPKPMDLTSGYAISLPVFAGREEENGTFLIEGEVAGTAFSLGNEFMITAGHVVKNIDMSSPNCMILGLAKDASFKAARVVEAEPLDKDIAVLRVEFNVSGSDKWFRKFKWHDSAILPLQPIRTVGYAYGMHTVDDRKSVIVRGFQGYVVARLPEFKPVGYTGDPFGVYELSFAAPRGLSGAPLMNVVGTVVIHGVIIGNSEAQMTVFRSEERIKEIGKTIKVEQYEKYEALTLGVAVTAREIFSLKSNLLGASVRDHLEANDLLTSAT